MTYTRTVTNCTTGETYEEKLTDDECAELDARIKADPGEQPDPPDPLHRVVALLVAAKVLDRDACEKALGCDLAPAIDHVVAVESARV